MPGVQSHCQRNLWTHLTVQGEGSNAGRRCGFIRLARCNLDCGAGPGATWCCDTPYSWDWDGKLGVPYDPAVEARKMAVGEVAERIDKLDVDRVVITGGEPMLQRAGLTVLCEELSEWDYAIEIETNGTQSPWSSLELSVEQFNVSVKLANSGVAVDKRISLAAIHLFNVSGKATWKFVCSDVLDLDEVQDLVDRHELPRDRVWIMPAGTRPSILVGRGQRLADEVIARGWNLTSRLHVLTWGDARGR